MSNDTIITNLEELSKAIKANSQAHKKVDERWQVLAMSAIAAFAAHGNVFYINQVWKSLGKGTRHEAMTAYMLAFGGVKANTEGDKDEKPFIKNHDKKVDTQGAAGTKWWDMAPSKAPDEVVDYLAIILKAAKRSPKEGQTVAHSKFRDAVLRLAEEHEEQEAAAPTGEHDPLSGVGQEGPQEPQEPAPAPAPATMKRTRVKDGKKVEEPATT